MPGAKDILKGYKLFRIEITDEKFLSEGEEKFQMTLLPSKDITDFVEGTVFEISEAELLLTDKYEPNNYERVKAVLASGKEAWFYALVN